MSQNGHDPMVAAIEQARQQDAARQMQAMALQSAASDPHTIERIKQSATGIAQEQDGTWVLLVATMDGRRRDVELSPESRRVLLHALMRAAEADESPAEAA